MVVSWYEVEREKNGDHECARICLLGNVLCGWKMGVDMRAKAL